MTDWAEEKAKEIYVEIQDICEEGCRVCRVGVAGIAAALREAFTRGQEQGSRESYEKGKNERLEPEEAAQFFGFSIQDIREATVWMKTRNISSTMLDEARKWGFNKGVALGREEQRTKDAEIAEAWLDGFGELSLGERIKEEILSQSVVQGAASAPERDDTKERT